MKVTIYSQVNLMWRLAQILPNEILEWALLLAMNEAEWSKIVSQKVAAAIEETRCVQKVKKTVIATQRTHFMQWSLH